MTSMVIVVMENAKMEYALSVMTVQQVVEPVFPVAVVKHVVLDVHL